MPSEVYRIYACRVEKWLERREVFKLLEYQKTIEECYKLHPIGNKRGNGGPADLYKLDNAKGIIGFINAISGHFCPTCNRLRLTADGKLRPCLFSDKDFDVRMAMRQGDSDDKLRTLLHTALSNKPKGHAIAEPTFKKCAREMVKIGG